MNTSIGRALLILSMLLLTIGSAAAQLTQENRTNSNYTRSGSSNQPDLSNVGRDLGVNVLEVQINDVEVETGDSISLSTDLRETLDIRTVLQATVANGDVEVEASIRGDDTFQMIDNSDVFRVEPNTRYVKTLKLTLPPSMDEGTYYLRVAVYDRSSAAKIFNYFLTVEPRRHDVVIRDVTLNPNDEVSAGRAVLGIFRLTNYGQNGEDDIKVTLAIPALGVSVSDYVDQLDAGDSISSEELLLRIPVTAQSGTYPLIASIDYHDGLKHDSRQFQLKVSGTNKPSTPGTDSGMTPAEEIKAKTIVTIGPQSQDAARGEGGAIYPVTIENQGSTSKSYSIAVSGAESFATVRISPSNLVVVEPGETKQVFVYTAARDGATLGPHVFNMDISGNGKTLQQVPLTLNVVSAQTAPSKWNVPTLDMSRGLTITLVVLIIAGIIVAVMLFSGKKPENMASTKTYY